MKVDIVIKYNKSKNEFIAFSPELNVSKIGKTRIEAMEKLESIIPKMVDLTSLSNFIHDLPFIEEKLLNKCSSYENLSILTWLSQNSYLFPFEYLQFRTKDLLTLKELKLYYKRSVFTQIELAGPVGHFPPFAQFTKSSSYLIDMEIVDCKDLLDKYYHFDHTEENFKSYFFSNCTLHELLNHIINVLNNREFDNVSNRISQVDLFIKLYMKYSQNDYFNFVDNSFSNSIAYIYDNHIALDDCQGKNILAYLQIDLENNFKIISVCTLEYLQNHIDSALKPFVAVHISKRDKWMKESLIRELLNQNSSKERWYFNDKYCTSCMNEPCICSDQDLTSIF